MSDDFDDSFQWDEIVWSDDEGNNWDEIVFDEQLPLSDIEWDAQELGFTIEELERFGALDFLEVEDSQRRGMFVSMDDAENYANDIPVPTEIEYDEDNDYYTVVILYDTVYG